MHTMYEVKYKGDVLKLEVGDGKYVASVNNEVVIEDTDLFHAEQRLEDYLNKKDANHAKQ